MYGRGNGAFGKKIEKFKKNIDSRAKMALLGQSVSPPKFRSQNAVGTQ